MDIVTWKLAVGDSNKYTDDKLAAFGGGLHYKGGVDYFADLPTAPEIGDVYTVKYKGETGTEPWNAQMAWGNYKGTNQWMQLQLGISTWGQISGDINNQTDLKAKFDSKADDDKVVKKTALDTSVQDSLDNGRITVKVSALTDATGVRLILDGGSASI